MKMNELNEFALLIESHLGLKRQGPGSDEMTLKALSFVDNLGSNSKIADIGCGTGAQTITLAKNALGEFVGVDMVQDFVDIFNKNIKIADLTNRVKAIAGDALDLPFEKESLDLIWSEGMIDSIGFEKTLCYWNAFIKKDGFAAVTSPSWLTKNRPEEISEFWVDAGSGLYAIEDNILSMQKAGYRFVSAFTLPESCWMDGYFIPRMNAEKMLREKYPDNQVVEDYIRSMKYEVNLYRKHKADYGYVFYIGKKI